MSRVIGIGIDAGTIDLIDELLEAGSLPNLAGLRARSVRTRLDGAPNHQFGVIWPQFIAGAEARLAGEWLRFSFDPSGYEGYQSGAQHRIEGNLPFWELAQVRTVTLDVPSMTVAGPGVHVTAWGADAPLYPRASQPRGLLRELDARFGVHPGFETYDCGWHDPKRLERMTDACVTGARRRAEVAVELMTRFDDWELFLTVMSEAHMASEIMWHSVEPDHPLAEFDPRARARLERVFNAIDDAIGLIVARAPDDATIVVFSLDGMRKSHGDVPSLVLLPELMHRRHFGTPKLRDAVDAEAWRRDGCPPLVPRRGRPWRVEMNERLIEPPPRTWSQRIPGYQAARLSGPGRRVLERIKGMPIGALGIPVPPECMDDPETMDGGRDSADEFLFIGNYREHRSAMRAFPIPTFGGAYVRINLAGRDAAGVVPIDEFDAECRAFESFIGECRDVRTGQPVAKRVLRLGDDDPLGPSARYGDLFVEWRGPTDAIEHPDVGVVGPVPFNRTGAHSDRGFAWISGNGLTPRDLPGYSVLDLPPTIVRLLGDDGELPPSGRPLPELAGIRGSR